MLENEASLLKVLLNELSHLISTTNIKAFISLMAKSSLAPEKALETLFASQAFKTLYYTKVKSITAYKGSFEQFYDKYLDRLSKHKPCIEVIQKYLVQAPYAAGFGTFLI
jgi:hypothetical protein